MLSDWTRRSPFETFDVRPSFSSSHSREQEPLHSEVAPHTCAAVASLSIPRHLHHRRHFQYVSPQKRVATTISFRLEFRHVVRSVIVGKVFAVMMPVSLLRIDPTVVAASVVAVNTSDVVLVARG